mmetsp:Transcript_44255/g.44903  ORF Transcript_44255/g.44903 Transcript_44255/m.44903 type:complete len:209 (-) Transcript_44255:310-936(-)
MTDATTSGLFKLTSSDADRNVIVVGTNNETNKRSRTNSDTSSSSEEATNHSETSSIENSKRICYEGCGADNIITGLLSLDNSNNITININSEINSNGNINAATHNSQFDLPIPNPLTPPAPPVAVAVPVPIPNPLAPPVSPVVHSLLFPPAGLLSSNNDHDHAEATSAGVEEAIAEVEEALFGTIQVDQTLSSPATVSTTTSTITTMQ